MSNEQGRELLCRLALAIEPTVIRAVVSDDEEGSYLRIIDTSGEFDITARIVVEGPR